jgi:hypothetical protein
MPGTQHTFQLGRLDQSDVDIEDIRRGELFGSRSRLRFKHRRRGSGSLTDLCVMPENYHRITSSSQASLSMKTSPPTTDAGPRKCSRSLSGLSSCDL